MAKSQDPDFVRNVEIGTRKFRIEYSFLALARLERAYGASYQRIGRIIAERQVSVDLAIELIRAGLNGNGAESWTTAEVARVYQALGLEKRGILFDAALEAFYALFLTELLPQVSAEKKGDATTAPPTGPGTSVPPPA